MARQGHAGGCKDVWAAVIAERARSLLRRTLTPRNLTVVTGIHGRRLGRFKFARQPIDRYAPHPDRLPLPNPPPLALGYARMVPSAVPHESAGTEF